MLPSRYYYILLAKSLRYATQAAPVLIFRSTSLTPIFALATLVAVIEADFVGLVTEFCFEGNVSDVLVKPENQAHLQGLLINRMIIRMR